MAGGGLQITGVRFAYNGSGAILQGISLDIPAGQFVSLLGASGSGKSTLLRLIAGLRLPQQGSLLWNGAPIVAPGLERGVVFQDYALFPWMTVVENIAVAIGKARPASTKAERREEAERYLRKVGLESARRKYPFELSGGMRQRGAIARALAVGSPLLLMDEPFGAVDPVNRARLQDLLDRSSLLDAAGRRARPVAVQQLSDSLRAGAVALVRRTALWPWCRLIISNSAFLRWPPRLWLLTVAAVELFRRSHISQTRRSSWKPSPVQDTPARRTASPRTTSTWRSTATHRRFSPPRWPGLRSET